MAIETIANVAKEVGKEVAKETSKETGKAIVNLEKRKAVENLAPKPEKGNLGDKLKERINIDKRLPNDKPLEKNKTTEINGYTYKQDKLGRTVSAEGKLRIESVERDKNAQLRAGGSERLETDDGGHLIGRQFGGIGEIDLVAQDRSLNQGPYRELEQKWADAVKNGDTVYVKVEPVYKGDSIRPDSFRVSYSINGEKFKKVFSNKPNAYAK